MTLDPVLLSRLQFAWVIAWHILLPAFTVGLSSFIAVLEGLRLVTGRDVYVRISSFWILAANSWMQTPAGYEIVNGQFFPKDWFEVIFSPSFPYRLAHVVVGF